MKRKKLIKEIRDLGFWLKREGGSHEIWTNGTIAITVPRHRELNELTAKGILKDAKNG